MPKLTVDQWHALRGRLYAVLAVLGPLLAFYGVVSSAEYALWVGVVTAALGNGLAATNVALQRRNPPSPTIAQSAAIAEHARLAAEAYRAAGAAAGELVFKVSGNDLVAALDKHKRNTGQ